MADITTPWLTNENIICTKRHLPGDVRRSLSLSHAICNFPVALFASGEQGAWYDPSDSSTLFQDAAGTTRARAGDPVGLMQDKSGNGLHVSQGTAAARPTLQQTAGGLWYLDFDGTDDQLLISHALGASIYTLAAAGSVDAGAAAIGVFLDLSRNTDERKTLSGGETTAYARDTRGVAGDVSRSLAATWPHVIRAQFHATDPTALAALLDGVVMDGSLTGSTGSGVSSIRLGQRGGNANVLNGRFFGGVIVDRALTADEAAGLDEYLASKAEVTL